MSVALLYSGGLDSSVLLYDLLKVSRVGHEVFAISVNYGSKHNDTEIKHAAAIVRGLQEDYPVNHIVVRLPGIIEVGQTFFPSKSFDATLEELGYNPTIFPGRNALLITVANAVGMGVDCDELWVAVGGHDNANNLFPDCSFEFMHRLGQALSEGYGTHLMYPYIDHTRVAIVQRGAKLGVPYEDTYSCYRGESVHCGTCPTCQGRKQGFSDATIQDPTEYLNDTNIS